MRGAVQRQRRPISDVRAPALAHGAARTERTMTVAGAGAPPSRRASAASSAAISLANIVRETSSIG